MLEAAHYSASSGSAAKRRVIRCGLSFVLTGNACPSRTITLTSKPAASAARMNSSSGRPTGSNSATQSSVSGAPLRIRAAGAVSFAQPNSRPGTVVDYRQPAPPMTAAVRTPERMTSLTAIRRSGSERSGLGAARPDTVAHRFRPGWPGSMDELLQNAPHRSTARTLTFDQKPGRIVCALVNGVLRVESRLDPLSTGEKESWPPPRVENVYLGERGRSLRGRGFRVRMPR